MANPEEMKEAKRRYAERFPERIREGKRRRYHNNGDAERAKMRSRAKTPEYRETLAAYAERRRWGRMERVHGLTQVAYEAMWNEQGGKCAICRRKLTDGLIPRPKNGQPWPQGVVRPHIDHCHTTGRVRGILCGQCNAGIGMLNEDPDTFMRALGYLKRGIDYRPGTQQGLPMEVRRL